MIAISPFFCRDTTTNPVNVEGVNIFYIPNSFTPDGDSFNEEFTPLFSAGLDIYDYHMTVFNRYGEIVFESYDVNFGWTGNYGDRGKASAGVYVWQIEFGDLTSDEKHLEKGFVNLID